MRIYALDIGASAVKRAIVETGPPVTIVTPLTALRLPPTPTVDAVRDRLLTALTEPGATDGIKRIGIATTGAVDTDGTVLRAGAIQRYTRIHWPTLLAMSLPALRGRIHVTNDGLAATWAEYHWRGLTGTHVHITLGSGIGGAIATGGRLVGTSGAGPAGLGHILVHPTSTVRCSCTRVGCVETLASARAIRRAYQSSQRAVSAPHSSSPPRTPTLLELTHLAQHGDATARRAFAAAGYWLGIAAANLVNILNPDSITVGGGLARAAATAAGDGDGYLAAAQQAMRDHAVPRLAAHASLDTAAYGADAELLGAALLAASP